jgi:hypothetical protein
MKRTMLALLTSIVAIATLSSFAEAKKQPTTQEAVAAITQFENDAVKADLAGDSSFVEKIMLTTGPAASAAESGPRSSRY